MNDEVTQQPAGDEAVEREISRKSRRGFLSAALAVFAVYEGRKWLIRQPETDGVIAPLRRVLGFNERVARRLYHGGMAREHDVSEATDLRENGDEGLGDDFDPATWKLRVFAPATGGHLARGVSLLAPAFSGGQRKAVPGGRAAGAETLQILRLAQIKALPKTDMVTEHKCVEGWSQIVHWTGTRFAEFAARYGPGAGKYTAAQLMANPGLLPPYVSMVTPDGGYYVGLDTVSALHPQTLLCWNMNGEALTLEHGAPLRLAIPIKYGVKSIKRIGSIHFTDRRPADFWAEQGYDWYLGL